MVLDRYTTYSIREVLNFLVPKGANNHYEGYHCDHQGHHRPAGFPQGGTENKSYAIPHSAPLVKKKCGQDEKEQKIVKIKSAQAHSRIHHQQYQ